MCFGAVTSLRRFLCPAERHRLFLLQIGVPRILLLGEHQVGRGGFETSLGFLDSVLNLVFGKLKTFLRSGLICFGCGEGAASDFDLNGNFETEASERQTLAA